jgi:hypothetical protein
MKCLIIFTFRQMLSGDKVKEDDAGVKKIEHIGEVSTKFHSKSLMGKVPLET